MSTKTIAGVGALIAAKIAALKDVDENIVIPEVVQYPSTIKTKYPSAEVLPTGAILTKRLEMGPGRNEREITFEIRLYQEAMEQGLAEDATGRIEAAVDAILTSFDTDPDLSDEVVSVMADTVTIDYGARFPKVAATIEIKCAIIITTV